jgi:hypothetical protein
MEAGPAQAVLHQQGGERGYEAEVNSLDERVAARVLPVGARVHFRPGPARGRRSDAPAAAHPPESMVTLTWDLRTLSEEELWALRPLAERALEGSPGGTAPRPVAASLDP